MAKPRSKSPSQSSAVLKGGKEVLCQDVSRLSEMMLKMPGEKKVHRQRDM